MKALADDPKTLFRAASQAEKVMTFLDIPAFEREPLPQIKKDQEAEKPDPVAETPAVRSTGRGRKKQREREVA